MQAFFTHERKQLSRKKVTMSEVSDATQIIMMTARGGYLLGKISIAMASRTLKLLDTLYHAKWKGKTSFNRLRQTKGEDLLFINI